jgi:SNF2 family DNA or RNA helicase
VDKLASALSDAQVDLNPHQIEAALFAFRSPLSKGAILADEVGLGKTIEAGILLAQRWAERRRRLLVICPANLRKQWSQELADKFYLPSVILETRTFNEAVKRGNLNPFQQDAVVICSFQFARSKEPYVRQSGWELIVIDEAHRLRNVYKQTNKVAQAIKQAVAPFQKVLLTAPFGSFMRLPGASRKTPRGKFCSRRCAKGSRQPWMLRRGRAAVRSSRRRSSA